VEILFEITFPNILCLFFHNDPEARSSSVEASLLIPARALGEYALKFLIRISVPLPSIRGTTAPRWKPAFNKPIKSALS
jgi:hypothetical protein